MLLRNADYDPVAAENEKDVLHSLPFFMEQDHYDELRKRYRELKAKGKFEHHLYSMQDAVSCEGICHWAGYGFYINSSGKIRPCVEIPHNREQDNLPDEKVDYNYEELLDFRRSFVNGHVPEACMDCAFIMSNEVDCLKVNMKEYSRYFQDKVREKARQ
jgi:radical SAM protein with 4Fe4S-binding SPASM domain